jgi:hypothetical protein
MDTCDHGMDPTWCYLCRVEAGTADPSAAWGLRDHDGPTLDDWEDFTAPMTRVQRGYLRFLCEEFDVPFDDSLTEGEAAAVIVSFLEEPMTASQERTLASLSERAGTTAEGGLAYGEARQRIRQLVALRGLRSA